MSGYPTPGPSPTRREGDAPAVAGWGRGDSERLIRILEADPSVEAAARAVDPALVARLAARVALRVALRPVPVMEWGALAACALLGLWLGWSAPRPPPRPTLLAAVQISPFADPLP